jgi:hypothetical protein
MNDMRNVILLIREKSYGVYFDDRNELTLEKIKDSLEG